MKNALLLSLALIAVGPVAVEGQTARDFDFWNRLLQAQDCIISATSSETRRNLATDELIELTQTMSFLCSYQISGLSVAVTFTTGGEADHAVFNVVEVERGDFTVGFSGLSNNYVTVIENPLVEASSARVYFCVGSKNTGSPTTNRHDCL